MNEHMICCVKSLYPKTNIGENVVYKLMRYKILLVYAHSGDKFDVIYCNTTCTVVDCSCYVELEYKDVRGIYCVYMLNMSVINFVFVYMEMKQK